MLKCLVHECIVIVIFCSNQFFPSPDPLPTIADLVRTEGFHFAILSTLLRLWSQKTKRKTTKTLRQKTKTKTSSQPGCSFKPSSHICVLFMLKNSQNINLLHLYLYAWQSLKNSLQAGFHAGNSLPQIIQVPSSSQSSFIKLFSRELTRAPTLFPWFPWQLGWVFFLFLRLLIFSLCLWCVPWPNPRSHILPYFLVLALHSLIHCFFNSYF